jgi:hypothetical protein
MPGLVRHSIKTEEHEPRARHVISFPGGYIAIEGEVLDRDRKRVEQGLPTNHDPFFSHKLLKAVRERLVASRMFRHVVSR